jgi:serine/threonine-protein kinase
VAGPGAGTGDGQELAERLQAQLGPEYVVGRELGGGGMSRIFLAHDIALDRDVVIKVLPQDLALGVSVERFRREIMLAAALNHPNIVPVLRAGEIAGLPYFLMPFIRGESLRSRLARGPLSVRETTSIL